jgi:hypothetical protein
MAGATRTLLSLAAVLALAACSSTTPITAPAPLPNHDAENAAWIARDFTCTRAEAKAVNFNTLRANPKLFDEGCVRVSGFFDGVYLVRDAGEHRVKPRRNAVDAYMKDKKEQDHYQRGPTFAVVTGRVRSCAARAERQTSATTPLCRGTRFGLFVSDVQVVPTAMD